MKKKVKAMGKTSKTKPSIAAIPKAATPKTETPIVVMRQSEDFIWFPESNAAPPSAPPNPRGSKPQGSHR